MTPPSDRARRLFARPTLEVADAILGWRLVRDDPDGTRRSGRIVEVEAYIGEEDRASHARFGRTARNEVMYGPPGRAYVYLVYGMHDCLNLVTEPAGSPAAILVRAVAPLDGIERMRVERDGRVRARTSRAAAGPGGPTPAHRLAAGPGLVCAAFGLDRTLTGADLLDPSARVRLEPPPPGEPSPLVAAGPRIGVDYAGQPWTGRPWRRWIAGDPSVSRPDRSARRG
ncbi:MAG TPA: DNA-3-methyladenine glycosylase [Candidatus Limnocylindrales bacterium]|nr:DNA-3-methyladenine glycosylase [Candidatus Limnocylindrales bacterium]